MFGGSFSEFEPFSNWGKFPVEHDGRSFPTLEHAYQAKEIGDKVKVTDDWDFAKREAVMKTLIDVKFSTGSALAKELLDTGKKIIVESGRDNYYACGLSFTNKNIPDRKSYTGKNKLGVFLMERRDSLR